MKKMFRPFTLLLLLGVVLAVPLIQGCASASVMAPDSTPLDESIERDAEAPDNS